MTADPSTLTDADIDRLAAAIIAKSGPVTPPEALAEPHPAETELSKVDDLLARLRIGPTTDAIATVEQWLIDHGYEEAPAAPVAEDDVPGSPAGQDVLPPV